ncbi:hypothetical protein C6Y45_08240 [Alkalicoccus saliphilus]|jgi:uncharacterized membrane protein YheB (UPF0754 family)|uniref:DUF445 domain-containing protein n=2 Tax=Alkalicoccus saliphilus TaxID=200989 RepID=A0A2T4U6D8_9BACI|nr:hypothetical protein C6Y45_08240 [Alkalicoccus saliphilus]
MKMGDFGMLLLVILIGGVIGGGTNIVAIRMLFRPYRAWYIGKKQVPFTPGLIPKRRGEIADNLGMLVEDHLVTPEGMKEKLAEGFLVEEVEKRLQQAVREMMEEERTLDEWVEHHIGRKDQLHDLRINIEKGLTAKVYELFEQYKHRPVREWLPPSWNTAVEERIPVIVEQISWKGAEYVDSIEGREKIDTMLTQYLQSKGNFSSFVGRLTHRFSLSDTIARELVRFLKDADTKKLMEELLLKEWRETTARSPDYFLSEDKLNEQISLLTSALVGRAPVVGEWSRPLSAWSGRYEEFLNSKVIPSILSTASMILSKYIKSIMKHIGIRDLVTREVNTFPLARLEEMLLIIANRELKMIAVLGALIGAVVGLIQGVFLLFIW